MGRVLSFVCILSFLPATINAQSLFGDIDQNGRVDFEDFLILARNFGKSVDSLEVQQNNPLIGIYKFSHILLPSGNELSEIGPIGLMLISKNQIIQIKYGGSITESEQQLFGLFSTLASWKQYSSLNGEHLITTKFSDGLTDTMKYSLSGTGTDVTLSIENRFPFIGGSRDLKVKNEFSVWKRISGQEPVIPLF